MFESIVCGFIVFAIGYTNLMRLMARRADVLHGEFIHSDIAGTAKVESSLFAAMNGYVKGIQLLARR